MDNATDLNFESIFKQTLGMGVDIGKGMLQQKAATVLAKEEAKQQIIAQEPYNRLAALQPNLGPNDPRAASQAAALQTGIMQGFIPTNMQPYMKYVLIGVVLLAVLLLIRRK